jgi:hypothetical protein
MPGPRHRAARARRFRPEAQSSSRRAAVGPTDQPPEAEQFFLKKAPRARHEVACPVERLLAGTRARAPQRPVDASVGPRPGDAAGLPRRSLDLDRARPGEHRRAHARAPVPPRRPRTRSTPAASPRRLEDDQLGHHWTALGDFNGQHGRDRPGDRPHRPRCASMRHRRGYYQRRRRARRRISYDRRRRELAQLPRPAHSPASTTYSISPNDTTRCMPRPNSGCGARTTAAATWTQRSTQRGARLHVRRGA